MSCVHYKFRSSLEYDTITFDGLAISLGELKSSIMAQKKFGKNADFDLEITNAQTKEVYKDEPTLIPKNSSVVIRRIPLGTRSKAQIASDKSESSSSTGTKTSDFHDYQASFKTQSLRKTANLAHANATEDDKLKAMMSQAGEDWDPSQYVRGRGRGFSGSIPNSYVCYRCGKAGHYIRSCPTNGDNRFDVPKVKRTTGIPRMFLASEGSGSGGSSPRRPQQDDVAKETKKEKAGPTVVPLIKPEPKKVPSELKCPMCNNLLTDAVLIPCCGTSYCDDCIRTYLLEDEQSVCPSCGQDNVLPNSLVINKQLRQAVNNFRNPRSSSPFMNTSQVPGPIQEASQDAVQPRQEEKRTAINPDVEKVVTGTRSPARSRGSSPKLPESKLETSKDQPTSSAQSVAQILQTRPKDKQQPKEANVVKQVVQKIEGAKHTNSRSAHAQDPPRHISERPREHLTRVPGLRPPQSMSPHSAPMSVHPPPFPGSRPTVAPPFLPGAPVVVRSLDPRPVVVPVLHPPTHDLFGIPVRPPFMDPFVPPDEPLPPPMSEEEFYRLKKGIKTRHRKKPDARETKRVKEPERVRDRKGRDRDGRDRERDRVRAQDQDGRGSDRGSDRESRGRRRGHEVDFADDFADELSQYRKIQRNRQRSSSWSRSRSRSDSRSESRSYSRSRSRSGSRSRSPSRSPTPEGWDRSRDPTPTSSHSASWSPSPTDGVKKEDDKTRKHKKRKKHHKHKRDKKQKTSHKGDDGGSEKQTSEKADKRFKRKSSGDDNEESKKKRKKNRKEIASKPTRDKTSENRLKEKPKGKTEKQSAEVSTSKKRKSSKNKLEKRTKPEKDKTGSRSVEHSKSKKVKLSKEEIEQKTKSKKLVLSKDGVEQEIDSKKDQTDKKRNRSGKEKDKSSTDDDKRKKHKSKSKKHKKKHKHKKKSKSDDASKKGTKATSVEESEEVLSVDDAEITGTQPEVASDSSEVENGSTQTNSQGKEDNNVLSSGAGSGTEDDKAQQEKGDDGDDDVGDEVDDYIDDDDVSGDVDDDAGGDDVDDDGKQSEGEEEREHIDEVEEVEDDKEDEEEAEEDEEAEEVDESEADEESKVNGNSDGDGEEESEAEEEKPDEGRSDDEIDGESEKGGGGEVERPCEDENGEEMEDTCGDVQETANDSMDGLGHACEDVQGTEGVADREGSEGKAETLEDVNSVIITEDAGHDVKSKDLEDINRTTEGCESKFDGDNKCERIDRTLDDTQNDLPTAKNATSSD